MRPPRNIRITVTPTPRSGRRELNVPSWEPNERTLTFPFDFLTDFVFPSRNVSGLKIDRKKERILRDETIDVNITTAYF